MIDHYPRGDDDVVYLMLGGFCFCVISFFGRGYDIEI